MHDEESKPAPPGSVSRRFGSEPELVAAAATLATGWRAAGLVPLTIALSGGLGVGKTTWVRALLRGLGFEGRVPSPTYTLVESYPLEGLEVVHVDLYRIADADEIEHLGLRERVAGPGVWLFVEWPERAPDLAAQADLTIRIALDGDGRRVDFEARSAAGRACLAALD